MKDDWSWKPPKDLVVARAETKRKIQASKHERRLKKMAKGKRRKQKKKVSMDVFYKSWEWKKARFEILKMYGAKCMCCNATEQIVVDHIKPRKKFPALELDLSNLQVLCNSCNMGKSNDDYTDFRSDRKDLLDPEQYAELEHLESTEHLH